MPDVLKGILFAFALAILCVLYLGWLLNILKLKNKFTTFYNSLIDFSVRKF